MAASGLETVQRFLELVGELTEDHVVDGARIDWCALGEVLSPEFVIRNPLFHPVHGIFPHIGDPVDGALRGIAGMKADIEATASHFRFSVSGAQLRDAGDVVLFFGVINVTGCRSARSMSSPFAELFFLEDGLIARIEPHINVNAFRLVI
jgi:hypothetical protein